MKTVRLAVTGLKGAGKTVFLTALINNLLKGTADTFEAFKRNGVMYRGEAALFSPGQRRFPYHDYMRELRYVEPCWPASTEDVSEFQVLLKTRRKRKKEVLLHFIDYPGERLLDMTLLRKDFDNWSDDVVSEAREGPGRGGRSSSGRVSGARPAGPGTGTRATQRSAASQSSIRPLPPDSRPPISGPEESPVSREELSQAWRSACASIPVDTEDAHAKGKSHSLGTDGVRIPQEAQRAVDAYKNYLLACRGQGFQFLQPSAFVLQTGDSKFLDLDFCPLPEDARRRAPGLRRLFSERFDAYRDKYVKPFADDLAKCSRQIVLVDVLGILRAGLYRYSDTQRCVEEILKVYSYGWSGAWYDPRKWPSAVWARCTGAVRIDRVGFVATKADQATRTNRPRLLNLLEALVRRAAEEPGLILPQDRISYKYCASYRSTEDAKARRKDQKAGDIPRSVLTGRRQSADGKIEEGTWDPGEVPKEWPQYRYDPRKRGYRFPDFLPEPLPDRDDLPIEHINLDEVLYAMIREFVR